MKFRRLIVIKSNQLPKISLDLLVLYLLYNRSNASADIKLVFKNNSISKASGYAAIIDSFYMYGRLPIRFDIIFKITQQYLKMGYVKQCGFICTAVFILVSRCFIVQAVVPQDIKE